MTSHLGFFPWIAFPFYFGNTNHGKTRSPAIRVNDSTLRLALGILEILATEKRAHTRQRSCSRSHSRLIFFLWIAFPFSYFSVVRKVTERPVVFLPHPFVSDEERMFYSIDTLVLMLQNFLNTSMMFWQNKLKCCPLKITSSWPNIGCMARSLPIVSGSRSVRSFT
jgi:hypothetical protein